MSEKIIDNKHLIHIVAEVVVMCGISFYFSSKIKSLQNVIAELSHKLEEQEDRLQKTNQLAVNLNNGIAGYIKKNDEQVALLVNKITDLEQELISKKNEVRENRETYEQEKQKLEKQEKQEKKSSLTEKSQSKPQKQVDFKKSSMKSVPNEMNPIEKMLMDTVRMAQIPIMFENPITTKVQFSNKIEEENEEENDISDSELDEEIQDELNDLKTKTSS